MRRLLGTIGLLCVAVLVACPAPGEGPKAERGFGSSAPVIAALARYRAETGTYPDSLSRLAPRWIAAEALRPPVQPGYPFVYVRTYDGYLLTFRYEGPGMNDCTWSQPPGRWRCGGHF